MQYIIAVFKSRNETLYMANMLMSNGWRVGVINTPREIGQTCGISVQFTENVLPDVRRLLASKPFRSFQGIYKLQKVDGKLRIIKL